MPTPAVLIPRVNNSNSWLVIAFTRLNQSYLYCMSQSGPPADAKQAQAAALQELESAQRRKRAIDTQLVSRDCGTLPAVMLTFRPTSKNRSTVLKVATSKRLQHPAGTS
jgi:hypothetical protein